MDEEIRAANGERMPEDEEHRENDTEQEYRYDDDFFEMEQSYGSEEEESCEEREWEIEEKLSMQDWEKEAKRKVRIEMDDPSGRRKTIYDLASYASSGPSVSDILKLSTTQITAELPKKIRYSVSMVNISA